MKSIRELRTSLRFTPHQINSQIKHFANNVKIDFDVYLPTKGINLQREFVWDINQKRELIWSILMNRHIPQMAMMNIWVDEKDTDGAYQIIDGKQRLSTMIGFYRNEFTLLIDGKEYYFKNLPMDYQNVIGGFWFSYNIANEFDVGGFTDEDKIQWFKFINFAGTPQEREHFELLTK